MQLLKPRVDLVFKMLFVENPHELRRMLEAILGQRLGELQILNPQMPGSRISEKGIVLDIRVAKADGSRISVEMQIRSCQELGERLAFYAARDFSKQLQAGQGYEQLAPTIVIVWLWQRAFPLVVTRLHRVFELRDEVTREVLTPNIAVHVLQLCDFQGHLAFETEFQRGLRRWAHFLSVETTEQLHALVAEDQSMSGLAQALQHLSDDPERARQAQEREEDLRLFEMERRAELAREFRHGEAVALTESILLTLRKRGVSVTDAERALIAETRDVLRLRAWQERAFDVETSADLFVNG